MGPFNRQSKNSVNYPSAPDDPDDWAFIMQQWTKIKGSVPNNNKKPNVPKSPQLLIPIKSERFEHPSPGPILESVKLEVVQSPNSPQILKPVKTEVFEIPPSNGTDCREAPKNAFASTNRPNTSKEIELPTKIRKSKEKKKKKKKKHKKLKSKRSTKLKLNDEPSDDNRRNELSKGLMESRFPPASLQRGLLDSPLSKMFSSQKSTNGISPICKIKAEIMEASMLKVKLILTSLLMETTENQFLIIAKEELEQAKSIAHTVRKKFSVLSSLSGKLGLKIYDSEDSDNSEKRRRKRNQLESDEELETLIERRKRNFEKIEMQIDLEIESRTEKEKSILYQTDIKKHVAKNDFQRNKVNENKLLKSTRQNTNNTNSKISNKVIPKSRNLAIDSGNKPKNQHHQTQCQQKSDAQSTSTRNGAPENRKSIKSIRRNLSSSSSTLSPSSLSSTTSCSSDRSSHRSYDSDSSRSDDSESDSCTRCKSKMSRKKTRSSSSRIPHSRHSRSLSKKCRTVRSPRDRHSPYWRKCTRYSSPCRRAPPSRFWNRRSVQSRRGRKSSERTYSKRNRYHSDSSESRRSSYERTER